MEKQIGILYSPLLLTDIEAEQIKSELQSVDLAFQKRKLGIQNAVWDEIIVELYLKFDLSNILVDDVIWEGFKLLVLKLLISGKDKVMQMVTSEKGQPLITDMPKHFIRIPIQIDQHYHQHFLISNKLPEEVVKKAFNGMLDAYKKHKKKWEALDSKPAYMEDYIRLKKNGTWKKIKDLKAFREKMKATHRKHRP